MIKKGLFLFLLLSAFSWLHAQSITVKSFKALTNDMTAASRDGKRIDQNGDVAALIKVVTTQHGFTFEGGALGIVDTKQENGEIWVWVPHGLRKMTVKHQQLGVLRDYFFPVEIEAERTYEMILVTGKVETVVSPVVTQQFLVFNVNPKDAKVTVDGMPWPVRDGVASKLVDFGEHNYSVEAFDHHADAGKVVVNDPDDKVVIDITLKKAYGFVKIEGDKQLLSQASIYIDNANGAEALNTPMKVSSGKHRVQVVHPLYKPYEQQCTVGDGETYTVKVDLAANFAIITLEVDDDAELWVDGENKGVRQWTGPLLEGRHTVICRKTDCHESTQVITVNESLNGQTMILNAPTPITGRLVVNSTPAMATLFIDGKEEKETPIQINEIAIGEHTLRLQKEGYLPLTRRFVIEADKTLSIDLEMVEKPVAQTNPSKPTSDNAFRDHPLFVTANVAYNPVVMSYGISVGTLKKIGWFVSLMSNFVFDAMRYSATADADGLVNGEWPGYTGNYSKTRISLLGGVTMRLVEPLYARVGLGYGMQVLSCYTNDSSLIRWPEGSTNGLDLAVGLQLKLNRFTFSIDGASTNFKTLEFRAGMGLCF
jgi:hypothetical protein